MIQDARSPIILAMLLERRRILAALPDATTSFSAGPALAARDPLALASIAADPSVAWWRRRACARALEGRLPTRSLPALWDRITDEADVPEVRIALLDVLGLHWFGAPSDADPTRERALAWLAAQDGRSLAYGLDEAVILARCRLGDLGSGVALARLFYDPWSHRRAMAERAAATLLDLHGLDAIVRSLGARDLAELVSAGPSAELRHLGVCLLLYTDPLTTIDAELLCRALHDPDIVVAQRAATCLVDAPLSDEILLAHFDTHADALRAAAEQPPPLTGRAAAACWALEIVRRRACTSEASEAKLAQIRARLGALGDFRVRLPEIPDDVREAVLREYLPGQRTTDPRFALELALLDHPERDPDIPQHARAVLLAAGFDVGEPVSIGEHHHQGEGSYSLVTIAGAMLSVCSFGPFVSSDDTIVPAAIAALEAAGFRWIDAHLGSTIFEGLAVYYFGRREPLPVADLLFYWQD